MTKYIVCVVRSAYFERKFLVQAEDEKQAQEQALAEARRLPVEMFTPIDSEHNAYEAEEFKP